MPELPTYLDALDTALDAIRPLDHPASRPLADALGATLAAPIHADRDIPPFHRCTMDGYAVRSREFPSTPGSGVELRLIGEVPAGAPPTTPIQPGTCLAVATGAQLPPGADAVIPHEQTDRTGPLVRCRPGHVRPWANVHQQGADARSGQVLLDTGTILDPNHLAIAAAVGRVMVSVGARPPRVRILSSGDEIRPASTPTSELQQFQIRDSNATWLNLAIPMMGARLESAAHLPDDLDATAAAVQDALDSVDLLVTIGGVSAGRRDHFPEAFQRAGAQTIIRGVAMQPGKPILIARTERKGQARTIVALPGNPVSVLATSHLFLWPIIRRLAGQDTHLPWHHVTVDQSVTPNPRRTAYRPAMLTSPSTARTPQWTGSGDYMHTAGTHGLLELPRQDEPIQPGAALRFCSWCWCAQGKTA